MSIMAFQYKVVSEAPILVAYNRDEHIERQSQAPKIQSGRPRVICGIDRKSGGTWFGINQHSMFCCCLNRFKKEVPFSFTNTRTIGDAIALLKTQENMQPKQASYNNRD